MRGYCRIAVVVVTLSTGHGRLIISTGDSTSAQTPRGPDAAISRQRPRIASGNLSGRTSEFLSSKHECLKSEAAQHDSTVKKNDRCVWGGSCSSAVVAARVTARATADRTVHVSSAKRRKIPRPLLLSHGYQRKALLARGGASWFPIRGGEPYDEFPDDFDYDAQEMSEEELDQGKQGPTDKIEGGNEGATDVGDGERRERPEGDVEGDTGWMRDDLKGWRSEEGPRGRSTVPGGGAGDSSRSVTLTAQSPSALPFSVTASQQGPLLSTSGSPSSSMVFSRSREGPAPELELAEESGARTAAPRPFIGVVLGAVLGALGLRILEGIQRRIGASSEEAAAIDQQTKIESLEDQLTMLEEDRRRAAMEAKEARAGRRKEERHLKEYVRTLELHLDQLSTEKRDAEMELVKSVEDATGKALAEAEEKHQAALAAANGTAEQLKVELEAVQGHLECLLEDKAIGDANLRTEQGRGAALEREIERLTESAATLTQQLVDAVAKAESAERDGREAAVRAAALAGTVEATRVELERAARDGASEAREQSARLREEMESALAMEKERLRKQMEDRLTTMRAGLKRRLQEMRDERTAGGSRGGVAGKGGGEGASGAGGPGNGVGGVNNPR